MALFLLPSYYGQQISNAMKKLKLVLFTLTATFVTAIYAAQALSEVQQGDVFVSQQMSE